MVTVLHFVFVFDPTSCIPLITIYGRNTLPARDAEEYNSFPAADLAFIKHWLDWTDDNVDLLLTAAPLPVAPGPGVVDGTAMTLNNTGYIFLFNPNSAAVDAPELVLDASLG